ncbi:MAG: heme lyase CcmF/NrfE family subunit [Pseudomonadota bacterium]
MIAEFGQVLLALALMTALYQGVFPLLGDRFGDAGLAGQAARAATVQMGLVAAAFAALTWLHATSDFSVLNVAENSHSAKPFIYKITGVWGNHEGSMLLWVLILAVFGGALALSKPKDAALMARTLSVQGWLAAGFIAFVLFTSNPFARLLPAPPDGRDLNPLLQDPGLAIHPPFLYLGYVGFSIVFSYAVAGLLSGRIDQAWARAARPWALASWVFLTVGIALGSWWAYYELGWGGFWAWDPVENASFMPWLAGTALVHSIRVLEVRGAFKAWTALLAISTFSLSLVGAFLVRSGILTSVHAFAVDPERGVFILAILAVVVGGSLSLFALRGPTLTSTARFAPVSREGGLLVNNILLVTSCATVFLGTFYPLFIDVVSGEKISVLTPYFNIVFPPFVLALFLAMAPGSVIAWKRGDLKSVLQRLWPAAAAAGAALLLCFWLATPRSVAAIAGVALAVWVGAGVIVDLFRRVRPGPGALARFSALPRSYLGMTVAHLGLAVVAFGVIGAGVWKSEVISYAQIGDTLRVADYDVTLASVDDVQGPNYVSQKAAFSVAKNDRAINALIAERRFYPVRGMQTTEAGVWSTLRGDLYFTINESKPGLGWAVHGYYKPLASWLWIGSAIMAFGGLIALFPAPLRAPKTSAAKSAALAAAE